MESACWWWPHTDFIMVCERPSAIHRELVDANNPRGWGSHRLHCDTGPAVSWDGWGVYSIHGVRVPAQVVEFPETLTAGQILGEKNVEVRRVMIEQIGHERFIELTGAQPSQQDDFGKLWRVDMEDDEPLVMVELLNASLEPDGTRKTYFLRVPPTCTTALGAVSWSFNETPETYLVSAAS